MAVNLLLILGILACAWMAVRVRPLLAAVLYLAAASVLVSILLYLVGAYVVAVIELTVGAGLVTVLLILTASIAGQDARPMRPVVPRAIALLLPVTAALFLAALVLPRPPTPAVEETAAGFASVFWQARAADVLVQSVLMFAGLLTVIGLLAQAHQVEAAVKIEVADADSPPATTSEEKAA